MNRRQIILMSAAGLVALSGCAGSGSGSGLAGPARPGRGVLDVARGAGLAAFIRSVETAGLTGELSGEGPFTLFVPEDAAFRAARLSPGREELRRVLAYHVVPGQVSSSFMTGVEMNHLTATGDILNVNGRGSGIRVNGANLVRRDLLAGNGVVHVVDRVLRPA